MIKILQIDSSIQTDDSITRQLTAEITRGLCSQYTGSSVKYRDVIAQEIPHLNGPIASGFRQGINAVADDVTLKQQRFSDELITEFLESNVLVIGAPMYNFSIASQLKAWLDRIAQAGKTFSYTENGPEGLSGDKTVIVVSARGGFYTEAPLTTFDHREQYLQAFFGFLGITHLHFIRAEGTSKAQEIRSREIASAFNAVIPLIASLNL